MRYAFYVSGGATRLKKLMRRPCFVPYRSRTAFVLTDNPGDAELVAMTADAGIRCLVHRRPESHRGARDAALSDLFLGALRDEGVDHAFVYGSAILVGDLLEAYAGRLINFHPSVLPAFPGLRAVDRALDEGAFLLGNTAHVVVEAVDAGPVVMQHLVHRDAVATVDDVLDAQPLMQFQLLRWLDQGRLVDAGDGPRIQGGDYSVGPYVPAVEAGVLRDYEADEAPARAGDSRPANPGPDPGGPATGS
ncbi:MAG: formyltransferase family protein [Longimicrobiales bacterium]